MLSTPPVDLQEPFLRHNPFLFHFSLFHFIEGSSELGPHKSPKVGLIEPHTGIINCSTLFFRAITHSTQQCIVSVHIVCFPDLCVNRFPQSGGQRSRSQDFRILRKAGIPGLRWPDPLKSPTERSIQRSGLVPFKALSHLPERRMPVAADIEGSQ